MMEIRVMMSFSFCNENSEIVRADSINEDNQWLVKDDTKTTLKEMYADGWTLKHANPIRSSFGMLLFLER